MSLRKAEEALILLSSRNLPKCSIGNDIKGVSWLINPKQRQVEIYRPKLEVKILDNPQTVAGENVLPGFVFDLATIMYL